MSSEHDTLGRVIVPIPASKLMDLAMRASGNGRAAADTSPPHRRVLSTSPALVTLTVGVATGIAAAVGADTEWLVFLGLDNLRLASAVCLVLGVTAFWRAVDHSFWVPAVEATFAAREDVANVKTLVMQNQEESAAALARVVKRQDVLGDMLAELRGPLREVLRTQAEILSRSGAAEASVVTELSERCQDLEADLASVRLWQKQIHDELMANLNGKVTRMRLPPSQES